MRPLQRHEDAAERIITGEGLAFALAARAGKEGDLREARRLLKVAIIKVLLAEYEYVHDKTLSADLD